MALSQGHHSPSDESRVSVTAVNEAVAELMRGDNPERVVDQALAATIGGSIRPSIEKMVKGKVGSGAELLGLSGFRTAVSQYLNSPTASQLDAETRKAMLHRLETANRTGSEFSALVAQGVRLAALLGASGETMREVARSEGRRSSADFAQAFNGGPYSAGTLSGEMRSYVNTAQGITAAHVAGVGNYLSGLGINAQQYTGYFVGSSEAIRTAISDHVKNGTKLTDDQIKNPNDVKAVIGAIKAGKMKKEDAPPSVQKVIETMEQKGLDATDTKAFDKYFKENPKALEGFKKANEASQAKAAGKTDAQIKAARDAETSAVNPHGGPAGGSTVAAPQNARPPARPIAAAKPKDLEI
jgi:hypothetical protein